MFLCSLLGTPYLYYRSALRRVAEEGWTLERLAQERSRASGTALGSASASSILQQLPAPSLPPPYDPKRNFANADTFSDASAAHQNESKSGLKPFEAQWEDWSEKQAQAAAARSPAAFASVRTIQVTRGGLA